MDLAWWQMLALTLTLLVGGAVLLLLGRRRRGKRGRGRMSPRCKKCGYSLHRSRGETCPECGTRLLFFNVRMGRPRHRPACYVLGGILLLLGGWSVTHTAPQLWHRWNNEWYELHPTWMVLNDLEDDQYNTRAKRLLVRRLYEDKLSTSHRQRLVQYAEDRLSTDDYYFAGNVMEAQRQTGTLNTEQTRAFLASLLSRVKWTQKEYAVNDFKIGFPDIPGSPQRLVVRYTVRFADERPGEPPLQDSYNLDDYRPKVGITFTPHALRRELSLSDMSRPQRLTIRWYSADTAVATVLPISERVDLLTSQEQVAAFNAMLRHPNTEHLATYVADDHGPLTRERLRDVTDASP